MATPDEYFDDAWSRSDDPWDHAARPYETRKYDLTAATVRRPRVGRAFEPGCGAGLLTARLARRCDELIAMDRHERAAAATRRRCPTVDVRVGRLPADWPAGPFDLVVLSEVLYYLDAPQVRQVLDDAAASLREGGELVAVHYRVEVEEHELTGDEVHELIGRHDGFERVAHHLEREFVLEGFERR